MCTVNVSSILRPHITVLRMWEGRVPESAWNGVVHFNLFQNLMKDSGLQASQKTFSPDEEVPLVWISCDLSTCTYDIPEVNFSLSRACEKAVR
jgi:hypothetical protein